MLILCSGPDTYHARTKARELVSAFRAKHDPAGYSTEVIDVDAPRALPSVLERIGSPSLFAHKRMIRCDGFLTDLKIADVRALAKRLEVDNEQTIVLSVENEPISPKHEKEFDKIKLVHYSYPLLFGAKFLAMVLKRAEELGVTPKIAEEIARGNDGDMWRAENELQKKSASTNAPLVSSLDAKGTVFDAADAFLVQRTAWRDGITAFPDESMISILTTQSRTCARVRDGETIGLHPYLVKKFSSFKLSDADMQRRLMCVTRALYAARNFATEEEGQTLL